jgi:hypothetical protein
MIMTVHSAVKRIVVKATTAGILVGTVVVVEDVH